MFFPSSLYQLIDSKGVVICGNNLTIFPHLRGEVGFSHERDFDGSGGSLGSRSISSVRSKSSSIFDSQSRSPTFYNKKKRKMREHHSHPTGLGNIGNTRNSRQKNFTHGAIRIAQKRLKDNEDKPRQG